MKKEGQPERLRLECVDCHVEVEGPTQETLDTMSHHVRETHNRELVFKRAEYTDRKALRQIQRVSSALLHPELILCA